MDEPKRRFLVKYHVKRPTTPIGQAQIEIIADDLEDAKNIAKNETWRQNYHTVGFDQIHIDEVEEIKE